MFKNSFIYLYIIFAKTATNQLTRSMFSEWSSYETTVCIPKIWWRLSWTWKKFSKTWYPDTCGNTLQKWNILKERNKSRCITFHNIQHIVRWFWTCNVECDTIPAFSEAEREITIKTEYWKEAADSVNSYLKLYTTKLVFQINTKITKSLNNKLSILQITPMFSSQNYFK